MDRAWVSPEGNLYASLLLSDPSPFEHAPELAFVAALALRDAIVAEAPTLASRLKFKWPNDLLLAGEKCAGILIEGETAPDKSVSVVIGIGVNCVSHPPTRARSPGDRSESARRRYHPATIAAPAVGDDVPAPWAMGRRQEFCRDPRRLARRRGRYRRGHRRSQRRRPKSMAGLPASIASGRLILEFPDGGIE